MKRLLLVLFLAPALPALAQQPDGEGSRVKWMTLPEALRKNDSLPKPILLDFYTSWCGWCKHMMKTTYADADLAGYINNYFYPATFNAEGKDTVEFLGKKYGPSSAAPRAPHSLTLKFLKDELMYPTTVFLNAYDKEKREFGVNMISAGYLDRQKMEPMLVYNVENVFRNCPYEAFSRQFSLAFYDSTHSFTPADVTWLSPRESFHAPVPKKKKTLVFLRTSWCNSCSVMQQTSFADTAVWNYLSGRFDLVDFDAQLKDSIFFQGQTFLNPSPPSGFHELGAALTRHSLILPSLAVLDEEMRLIDVIPYYIAPEYLDAIVHFYGDGVYQKKSWKEFLEGREKPAVQVR